MVVRCSSDAFEGTLNRSVFIDDEPPIKDNPVANDVNIEDIKKRIEETVLKQTRRSASDDGTDGSEDSSSTSSEDEEEEERTGNEIVENNKTVINVKKCANPRFGDETIIINNLHLPDILDVKQLNLDQITPKYITNGEAPFSSSDSIERVETKKFQFIIRGVAAAVLTTLILVSLIITLQLMQINGTSKADETTTYDEEPPPPTFNERLVNRSNWFARPPKMPRKKYPKLPLQAVVIDSTASFPCTHFFCPNTVLEYQARYQAGGLEDIPSNFILAEDGFIYEGRGWDVVGQLTPNYDNRTLGVLFMGNYRDKLPPPQANASLFLLLDEGVKRNILALDYVIYGEHQFSNSSSVGDRLIKDMESNWARWSENIPPKNCTDIHITTD